MTEQPGASLPQQKLLQKKNTKLRLLSLFFVGVVCGTSGYFMGVYSQMNQIKLSGRKLSPSITAMKWQLSPTKSLPGTQPPASPFPLIPTVSKYATPTLDPIMIDWKTYTDPSGFSLRYPPEFWGIQSYPSANSTQETVAITIATSASPKEPLRAGIVITKNTAYFNGNTANADDNETLSQVYQGLVSEEDRKGQPIQVVIGGYLALQYKGNTDLESYVLLAPGLGEANAEYTIDFGNPQASVTSGSHNPYSASDPFVQEQLTNFHRVLSSMRFPTK
jgi:hypothetical protein